MKGLQFKGKIFNQKEIETLYHVGTMDIADKSRFSLEGNGLSVSTCPSEWINITQMSSTTIWSLQKKDVQLLDYYSLTENEFNIATIWGLDEGYLTECIIFKSIKYDDEIEGYLEMVHKTFEEACEEACLEETYVSYEEYLQYQEYESSKVEKLIGYMPTNKLKKISMVEVDETNAFEINFLVFLEKNTNLDGVYWDEILDISKYSAPRGVIFNSKINSFKKKQVHLCDKCNKNIAQLEISEEKFCEHCCNKKYGQDVLDSKTNNYTCSKCGNEYFYGFGKCSCYKIL